MPRLIPIPSSPAGPVKAADCPNRMRSMEMPVVAPEADPPRSGMVIIGAVVGAGAAESEPHPATSNPRPSNAASGKNRLGARAFIRAGFRE